MTPTLCQEIFKINEIIFGPGRINKYNIILCCHYYNNWTTDSLGYLGAQFYVLPQGQCELVTPLGSFMALVIYRTNLWSLVVYKMHIDRFEI